MSNNYCVHITSARYTNTFDIIADNEDEASIYAVEMFFQDYPGAKSVRVASVEQFPDLGDAVDMDYNPYCQPPTAESSQESTYASYANHMNVGERETDCNGYVPFTSFVSSQGNTAAVAGFTTDLPAAPVLETSYHKPLPNGYAPYRSFRVILPR